MLSWPPEEANAPSISSSLLYPSCSFPLLLPSSLHVSLSFPFLHGIFYPPAAPDEKNGRVAASHHQRTKTDALGSAKPRHCHVPGTPRDLEPTTVLRGRDSLGPREPSGPCPRTAVPGGKWASPLPHLRGSTPKTHRRLWKAPCLATALETSVSALQELLPEGRAGAIRA